MKQPGLRIMAGRSQNRIAEQELPFLGWHAKGRKLLRRKVPWAGFRVGNHTETEPISYCSLAKAFFKEAAAGYPLAIVPIEARRPLQIPMPLPFL
jgi:hypothetical protein